MNYHQNDTYRSAMTALKQQESALPVYTGSYDAEINELFRKISSRPAFSYSPSADPLYGAYRDRYVSEGQSAMRDTMAQAAALTGGYGSTYSQSVGQQQFESYLSRLNDALPELYSAAYTRYKDEDTALRRRYSMLSDMADTEYTRYHDAVTDERAEREVSHKIESDEYKKLSELIFNYGYQPDSEELKKAGMSAKQAQTLFLAFCEMYGLNPDGSSPAPSSMDGSYWDYNPGSTQQTQEKQYEIRYV